MEVLLAPIILVSLVLFVAWPLLKEAPPEPDFEESTALDLAMEEKENALSNLKDIEMDLRMGKLSREDYDRLRAEWEVQAVSALEKLELLQKNGRSGRKKS